MDLPFEVDVGGESEGSTLASKVLVVDDEAVIRDVLTRLLGRESDISVANAPDAETALALLRDEKFDVLISDKNLPGMGGVELIAQARALRPLIEPVLITGYPSGESIIAAMAAGASDYLVKPFDDLRGVRAKIRAALERRTERIRSRDVARTVAGQAAALLAQGRNVPVQVWQTLEDAFAAYEQVVRTGGRGEVVVVGEDAAVGLLNAAGIPARRAKGEDDLARADVLVLELREGWRELADRVQRASCDVVLLGRPQADLGDLLEAISMRLELVDQAGSAARLLPDRVRAHLDRRSVQRAQAQVAEALAQFRAALQASTG